MFASLFPFYKRTRDRLKAARPERPPMIIDTLPAFLSRVALALLPGTGLSFASEYSNIASQHGIERSRFTQYALGDLVHEYQVLRELLIESLHSRPEVHAADLATIHRSIDEAIAEAASS